ncbi:MAG: hypothetical protein ACI9XK_001288 [Granulosicoccus sp.]|jgi:hypothetical protein
MGRGSAGRLRTRQKESLRRPKNEVEQRLADLLLRTLGLQSTSLLKKPVGKPQRQTHHFPITDCYSGCHRWSQRFYATPLLTQRHSNVAPWLPTCRIQYVCCQPAHNAPLESRPSGSVLNNLRNSM